jgi:signal peptidase II
MTLKLLKNFQIKNKQYFRNALIIALVIMACDLISKHFMFAFLDNHGGYVEIFPFFNLAKVYNPGVSFGMFDNLENPRIVLVIFASLILLFVLYWLAGTEDKLIAISLSFIIGGALGNIIDRAINGAVADFLDFHIGIHHWPAFNVADSFITIGAMILIYDELIIQRRKK